MLTLENVTKVFPGGRVALEAIHLTFARGEITALVGPSGCGKSTLLRLIAGLDVPSAGRVRHGARSITGPTPEIGIVFQEPRLLPWLTVAENVRFGLGERPPADANAKVDAALEKVGLAAVADALPRALSGGMAQRAALARALVRNPAVLLLDEPFSALDAPNRARLQRHFLRVWELDRPTLLVVTHDLDEALLMADHVVLLTPHPGRVQRERRVPLPRPRDPTDPEFQVLKRELQTDFARWETAAEVGRLIPDPPLVGAWPTGNGL